MLTFTKPSTIVGVQTVIIVLLFRPNDSAQLLYRQIYCKTWTYYSSLHKAGHSEIWIICNSNSMENIIRIDTDIYAIRSKPNAAGA